MTRPVDALAEVLHDLECCCDLDDREPYRTSARACLRAIGEGRVVGREEIAALVDALDVGCNCSAPDIGVGVLHEPRCGEPSGEDIADALLAAFREAGE